jgi:hypothetical protein
MWETLSVRFDADDLGHLRETDSAYQFASRIQEEFGCRASVANGAGGESELFRAVGGHFNVLRSKDRLLLDWMQEEGQLLEKAEQELEKR